MRLPLHVLALSAALGALPAGACDGVLEINQTCATTSGCFPGDAPALPVTITAAAPARSFRLTSDLTTASGNQTMISVSVPSVTLDLGGFRIAAPNACNGVPVTSCTAPGTGIGVTGGNDVTVKNGAIVGMGGAAVSLTYAARVESLGIFHCGGGILATDLAVIRGNVVTRTAGDGIHCRDYCVVSDNSATGHLADGIEVANGTVHGNAASRLRGVRPEPVLREHGRGRVRRSRERGQRVWRRELRRARCAPVLPHAHRPQRLAGGRRLPGAAPAGPARSSRSTRAGRTGIPPSRATFRRGSP